MDAAADANHMPLGRRLHGIGMMPVGRMGAFIAIRRRMLR